MDFMCLGPFEARLDGLPVDLGEPQRRLALALLVSNADSVVSTDRLIDGIWSDVPPKNARKIVQGYISGLRKALGNSDLIVSVNPGYRLNVKPEQIDAVVFEKLVAEGAGSDDPQAARQVLGEALALVRGGPFQDLADYEVLRPEITRLEQLEAVAVEARIEADILSGNESGVIAELADLTGRFPLRERLWSLHMLALYRTGRQAEALRAYDQARQVLAADVGLEPSAELRLLEQRVADQDPILHTEAALRLVVAPAGGAKQNPYKGLRAFEEADAADFYGREALVRRLREAMERRTGARLVVLAGPSGSGKSSVVRAGLIPALRADGWSIATIYPGSAPLETLDGALDELAGAGRRVVVVDQLEELITLAPEGSREQFLDRIADIVTGPDGPWVVVTVRADFLDPLLIHPRFAPLLEPGLLLVTPLEDHEVRDVIVGPASRVGVDVEPDLVAAMVRDVAHRATALPLLEYALTDLFDRAGGRILTVASLEAAGGISGALAKRAEEVHAGLSDAGRTTARQLLLRLVALTDDGEALRHRLPIDSVARLAHIDDVLDAFAQHRLLVADRDREGVRTVEVAHEALLREWPRLARWIDEARVSLRMLQQLTTASDEWEAQGRSDSYLLMGARIDRYADWPEDELALSGPEQEFLAASREAQMAEHIRLRKRRRTVLGGVVTAAVVAGILAVAAFVARSDATANAAIAQQNEALAVSRELAASAVALVGEDPELSMLLALEALHVSPPISGALGAGVLALREAAQQNRLLSRIPGDFTDARMSPDGSTIYVTSQSDRLVMAMDSMTGAVRWTFHDPTTVDLLPGFGPLRILPLSLHPDGQLLAVSVPDLPAGADTVYDDHGPARVIVLDTATGNELYTLEFVCRLSSAQFGGFSADGKWLVVGDGTDRCFDGGEESWTALFDAATGEAGPTLQLEGFYIQTVAFNAAGDRVLVYDVASFFAELRTFPELDLINTLPANQSFGVLGPTGEQAIVHPPETARRWLLVHADTGERIAYLDVNDFITGDNFRFSPDGSMVAATSRTHDFVYATETGELLVDLGNTGTTNSIDFAADSSRLVTASADGARVWDLGGRANAAVVPLAVPGAELVWMNPNRVAEGPDLAVEVIANDGPDGDNDDATVTVFIDPDTGETVDQIVGDSLQLPDGRFVVEQRLLGTPERLIGPLVVLDRGTGEMIELDGCRAPLADMMAGAEIDCPGPFFSWSAFSELNLIASTDGSYFAATSYAPIGGDRTVRVWDTDTLNVRSEFTVPYVMQAFAAGPSWIATIEIGELSDGVDTSITVYDLEGSVIAELEGPAPGAYPQVINALSDDGSILFMGDLDGFVVAVDTSTWEQVARWRAHDALLRGFAMSPEGDRLASTGQDDLVKIWDMTEILAAGSLVGPPTLLDRIPALFPSDAAWLDPDRLAVFLAEGGVEFLEVSLNVDELVAESTRRLTRSFTVEECAVYAIDPCPTLDEIRTR